VNVWAVSAGGSGREYKDLFLRYGAMFIGGGKPQGVPAFREQVREGDLVAMLGPKGKKHEISYVGRVTGTYEQLQDFDVDGWELNHSRRVAWRSLETPEILPVQVRSTFCRAPSARERILEMWQAGADREAEQPLANSPAEMVEIEDVIAPLIGSGLPVARAEEIASALRRVQRLARWYDEGNDQGVSEHEVRTFLVIPLLLGLGWSEQRIRIEYMHVDVALTAEARRGDEPPVAVIETKKLGAGLERSAADQARGYAGRFPECQRCIVTDGLRWMLSEKQGGDWQDIAYTRLRSLYKTHPYRKNLGGAVRLFTALLPT
jgi:hypothetical protein